MRPRAGQKDLDRCGGRSKPAPARIHTFISTSPVHMKWKLQMEPEQSGLVVSSPRARNYTDDVEWSNETAPTPSISVPLRRGRDQRGRHHHQHPRHRRLQRA
jgi:hypothetical protein